MRKVISILGIGLLAAACGGAGGSGSPVATAHTYDVATGSDQPVVRIMIGGGLVPIQVRLTQKPWFVLYGDGRIVVQRPLADVPGLLLPDLHQMRITPTEIQTILSAADRAGLLGPDARFDATDIYDASTTTFSATVAGQTHTIGAYALGYEAPAADGATAEARKKLSAFEDAMGHLSTFLGREVSDAEPYQAAEMRVFTRLAEPSDPASPTGQVVAWPLAVDPGIAGEAATVPQTRCLIVSGSDLETFQTIARTANTQTIWSFGAGRYSVYVRPLYPDEKGCPAS
jgi:hypothetical protein